MASYLSEIPRGPVVQGLLRNHSKVKNKLLHLAFPNNQKSQCLGCLFGFVGSIFPIWVCYSDPFTERPDKYASFEWGPEQEKALQQVQTTALGALPLGPCDPVDPTVLGMAVAEKDAVQSI